MAAKETTAGAQAKANTAEANAKAYTDTKVAGLVNSAPAALDTLKELANALGSDPNYAATTATLIGTKAPLVSPALEGTPTATTAAVDTSTTQVATTAFVLGQAGTTAPTMNGTAGVGASKRYARADHVHPVDTSRVGQVDFAAHLADVAKHVTAEKQTLWNSKYSKPALGIPTTDLAAAVQTAITKATSLSVATTSDTRYVLSHIVMAWNEAVVAQNTWGTLKSVSLTRLKGHDTLTINMESLRFNATSNTAQAAGYGTRFYLNGVQKVYYASGRDLSADIDLTDIAVGASYSIRIDVYNGNTSSPTYMYANATLDYKTNEVYALQ